MAVQSEIKASPANSASLAQPYLPARVSAALRVTYRSGRREVG